MATYDDSGAYADEVDGGHTDTIRVIGLLDYFESGSLTSQDLAYVITRSTDQLLHGFPDWYTGAGISAPYDGFLQVSSGSAKIYDLGPITLKATGFLDVLDQGHISKIYTDWMGTFEDFAIYVYDGSSYLGRDPATDAYVTGDNAGTANATGDITTAWTRHYRVVYPPKNARFAVPHIQFASTANTKGHYLDAFQWEALAPGTVTPQTWVHPRSVYARILPTRLNYSLNPSFEVSTANLTGSANVTLSQNTTDHVAGSACLQVVVSTTAGVASVRETTNIEVEQGEAFTVSMWVKNAAVLSGTYTPRVVFQTQSGSTISAVTGDIIHNKTMGWERRTLTTTVPQGAFQAQVYHMYSATAPAVSDTVLIDAVVIEKSPLVGNYFDGSFGGTEYLWDQGGTPGLCKSYFYEDRGKRHYIIDRVLKENVALGTQITSIDYANGFKFGLPYGFGPYGSGPYGG